AVLGTLAGSWPHPESGEQVRGDLGVLTALVPRARDGFELACDYARLGRDFTPLATRLGECVAQMHTRLRAEFGTQAHEGAAHLASEGAVASGLGAQLQQRCRWALEQVPALQAWSQRITATIEAAGQAGTAQADGARASEVQRSHGDLHLGQLLHSDEGWYVLDFEGGPLVPLQQRRLPDHPPRNVAGLLRSFDYAAAVARADSPAWREEARSAFLGGSRAGGGQMDQTVPHALELDKALYEAVYEARNRPDWLPIPLGAVRRLIEEETVAPTQEPAHPTPAPVPQDVLAELADGSYHAPHDYLGPHLDPETGVLTIRIIAHLASGVAVHTAQGAYPA